MATIAFFHAHPDDEAIATGGTMARLAAAGHRVLLVLATRGEHGEPVPGILVHGESLGVRRSAEAQRAAELLGVARVEFLGYHDSGMIGEPTNQDPGCFWQADVEEAAHRLAALLREEAVDALTIYDPNGGYGHPDHIQVHRVGTRAAELAAVAHLYWSVMNRDAIQRMIASNPVIADEFRDEDAPHDQPPEPDFGWPEAEITHELDVSAFVERKRDAMRAHASQIAPDTFFLAMPDEVFMMAFGQEWFVDPAAPARGDAPMVTRLAVESPRG
jgi:LmbE family N-acetylglucosaminyl deacetylase